MTDKLTIKQEKFVQGLFAGLSQREAYKQAYSCGKMSDNAIDVEASLLANLPKITQRLDLLRNELKNRNMVTAEKVLAEYAKIAFADIKDFLEFKTEKTVVDYNDEGKPIYGYKQIVEAKPSDEVDGTLINEVSISKDGTFKFKLHDKKGALDMLGKNMGLFTDKLDVNTQIVIKVKKPDFLTAKDDEE